MAVTRRLSPASLPCRDLVVSYIIEQGYQFAQGNLILGVGVELSVVLGGAVHRRRESPRSWNGPEQAFDSKQDVRMREAQT